MNINEYNSVKNMTYQQYCDHLHKKHGLGKYDYFTSSWNKNRKASRTKEGLVAHHKYEDHAACLADPIYAPEYPFEWQCAENLVYCDYLEHLLLHILICESGGENAQKGELVGLGGIMDFIVPELNDVYSGFVTKQDWRRSCYDKIIDHKDVYLELIKRLKKICRAYPPVVMEMVTRSYNQGFGLWDDDKNEALYAQIRALE